MDATGGQIDMLSLRVLSVRSCILEHWTCQRWCEIFLLRLGETRGVRLPIPLHLQTAPNVTRQTRACDVSGC